MSARLRVADRCGGAAVLTLVRGGAVVTVEVGACDVILDAVDLRDLARIATIAADELDRTREVTP